MDASDIATAPTDIIQSHRESTPPAQAPTLETIPQHSRPESPGLLMAPPDPTVAAHPLVAQLSTFSDDALVAAVDQFRPTPTPSPPHIAIPRPRNNDDVFDYRTVLKMPEKLFEAVFPPYNLVAPLIVRGNTGCHHLIKILTENPAFAKLVTHIDFVGFHSSDGGCALKVELVKLCKNLDTVTIDVALEDCIADGPYIGKEGENRNGLHSLGVDDIKGKYKFNCVIFDKDKGHKKRINNLNIRLVGDGVWWRNRHLKRESEKNPAANIVYEGFGPKAMMAKEKMIEELKDRMSKKAIKLKLLEGCGVLDRYAVRMFDAPDQPRTNIPRPE